MASRYAFPTGATASRYAFPAVALAFWYAFHTGATASSYAFRAVAMASSYAFSAGALASRYAVHTVATASQYAFPAVAGSRCSAAQVQLNLSAYFTALSIVTSTASPKVALKSSTCSEHASLSLNCFSVIVIMPPVPH